MLIAWLSFKFFGLILQVLASGARALVGLLQLHALRVKTIATTIEVKLLPKVERDGDGFVLSD